MLLQPRPLAGAEPEAELRAAPEDVVGALRPFLAAEPVDLAGGEAGAEGLAQVLGTPGVTQHRRGLAAIAADQSIRNDGIEPRIGGAESRRRGPGAAARERRAGQRRARGPGGAG